MEQIHYEVAICLGEPAIDYYSLNMKYPLELQILVLDCYMVLTLEKLVYPEGSNLINELNLQ